MPFSKSFPKNVAGSNYPEWVDVFLSIEEENLIDRETREKNKTVMIESVLDAKDIVLKQPGLSQEGLIDIAIALFEKRASHLVYAKERKCKDKFDSDKENMRR